MRRSLVCVFCGVGEFIRAGVLLHCCVVVVLLLLLLLLLLFLLLLFLLLLPLVLVIWMDTRYLLSDFVVDWTKKMKKEEPTEVTAYIENQLRLLQEAVPVLKNCKGDIPFTDSHWSELFRKLGIPKSVRVDTLTAAHFFAVLENVVASDRFCRELTARATGEVRLEEAMSELRDWCRTQEFTLVEHVELGRLTMMITDWKDLFTVLGDNQSLLSSLKESA